MTHLSQASHPRSYPVDKRLTPHRGAEPALKPSLTVPDPLQKTSHLSGRGQQIWWIREIKGSPSKLPRARREEGAREAGLLVQQGRSVCVQSLLCIRLRPAATAFSKLPQPSLNPNLQLPRSRECCCTKQTWGVPLQWPGPGLPDSTAPTGAHNLVSNQSQRAFRNENQISLLSI